MLSVFFPTILKMADMPDRMTLLGPRPIIASLSLGATRTFRLRKAKSEIRIETNNVGKMSCGSMSRNYCTLQ